MPSTLEELPIVGPVAPVPCDRAIRGYETFLSAHPERFLALSEADRLGYAETVTLLEVSCPLATVAATQNRFDDWFA